MKFKVEIDVSNSAFGETDEERNSEIVRILKKVIMQLNSGCNWSLCLKDLNGNTVGHYKFSDS